MAEEGSKTISTILGEVVWLMAQSRSHRRWALDDLHWLVMPALVFAQYRMFYDEEDRPVGFASWAYLTPEAEEYIKSTRARLRPEDWRPGGMAMGRPDPEADQDDAELKTLKTCIVDMVAPFATEQNRMLERMVEDLREGPLADRPLYARRLSSRGKTGEVLPLSS